MTTLGATVKHMDYLVPNHLMPFWTKRHHPFVVMSFLAVRKTSKRSQAVYWFFHEKHMGSLIVGSRTDVYCIKLVVFLCNRVGKYKAWFPGVAPLPLWSSLKIVLKTTMSEMEASSEENWLFVFQSGLTFFFFL